MTTEELVSVIVPVYNIEDYLPRCLACIEMQTYENLEIILVDDGSTDDSGRICDEYAAKDSRARVIHHPQNIGLWATRNTGQDAAQGEYIWMPDGDDYFHKDIVKVMYEAINQTSTKGKKYDLAVVGYEHTSKYGLDVSSMIKPVFVEKTLDDIFEVFVRPQRNITGRNVWNKLCRKDIINDIRTGNYKYAQDCDFSIKLYMKNPNIVYVDNNLYFFVCRPFSVRFLPDYDWMSKECMTKIVYDNYIHNQSKTEICRKLLYALYVFMAMWLDSVQGNPSLASVRKECNKMIGCTWKAYLGCKSINTPYKRLGRLLRVRFDKLYRAYEKYY